MQAAAASSQRSEFKSGLHAGMSIAVGYMPIALTFGLLAKTTGLSLAETVLMSLLVFAGASQYISLSLIAAGVGIAVIIFNTFIVNIRHFLMSASLNEKMEKDSLGKKALYAFGLTDETFSVIATREGKSTTSFAFGVMLIAYGSWVINSGIGHLIGASLPVFLQAAMSIALYAMFVGLLIPSVKKSVKVFYLALTAGALNSILTLSGALEAGWSIIAATLVSSIIVEVVLLARRRAGF
ncbi:AzlC family ABC transporter permease [Jeotgalibacillus proteolyticus]|uniref:Branched-chain amino acid ABC transporter permease n=1 Tax=Jeotgalibacillus proteolyticus TaxID=2082395 RepID=A0A2S5GH61_9BACL|nr:AzlC family ABC transporter permease [Jeotgalibacillus proteolyticus]PPA72387.1 branched-chain amino acid ABC transporter permease [Jeotgalibacillus proteolyticus]